MECALNEFAFLIFKTLNNFIIFRKKTQQFTSLPILKLPLALIYSRPKENIFFSLFFRNIRHLFHPN